MSLPIHDPAWREANGLPPIGGFCVRLHEPTACHWLYVDAGADPVDGLPLTHARRASPLEARLWEQGRKDELARLLLAQGVPVQAPAPRRQRWEWLRRLAGKLGFNVVHG